MDSSTKSEASKKVIDETRKLYSSILSRPLEQRQLARPSFKFIQELVKNLMIETRTLRDAFTTQDFDPKLVGDRQFRVKFVQKLIEYVARNGRPVINCLAARVVAGLEPNKTNELLQSLGKVARHQVSAKTVSRPRTFTRTSIPPDSPEKSEKPEKQPPVANNATINQQQLPQQQLRKQESSNNSAQQVEDEFGPKSPTKEVNPSTVKQKSIDAEPHKEQLKTREESIKSAVTIKQQQQQVFSESDVAKNIQQLQSSLRTLASELAETSQLGDLAASFSSKLQINP